MNRTISVYITQDQYNWLEDVANRANRSKSYIIQQIIDNIRIGGHYGEA